MPEHHDETEAGLNEDKLVPVTEAIRYRKRAQQAEQALGDTQTQLAETQSALHEATETIEHLERRQRIDSLLAESEAVDLETVRLLTEQAVAGMDEPDVKLAVDDLKRHKPFLFRRASWPGGMPERLPEEPEPVLEAAASRAIQSGQRRDLLAYLRLRRRGATG